MVYCERLSILYLDDEALCLDIFRQMFGREHDVRTALTVGEARRALADCSFDIVLSDYRMPETNGADFLQEVASAQPDCFRVMLTGAAGVGGFIGELGAGVIQLFLKKPWSEEGMRMALELTGAARARPLRTSGIARVHDSNHISTLEGA
jgi:DNA-binding NtrC family response regulator